MNHHHKTAVTFAAAATTKQLQKHTKSAPPTQAKGKLKPSTSSSSHSPRRAVIYSWSKTHQRSLRGVESHRRIRALLHHTYGQRHSKYRQIPPLCSYDLGPTMLNQSLLYVLSTGTLVEDFKFGGCGLFYHNRLWF